MSLIAETQIEDPRKAILEQLDLGKTRILLTPHIIFLCGGMTSVTEPDPLSNRDLLMRSDKAHSDPQIATFVLAETYQDWNITYSDLATFENDIAYISSVVAIIPESAGSLAELGMFYSNTSLRQKMTIILNEKYHSSDSFIKHGILNSLEDSHDNSVLVFDINHQSAANTKTSEIDEAIEDIIQSCHDKNKTEAFDLYNRGHIIFLIFQIIDLFHSLTLTEIHEYLQVLKIHSDSTKVKTALYILEKFEMIYKIKRSNSTFYLSKTDAPDRVKFGFVPSSNKLNYSSIKIQVKEFYNRSPKQRRRNRVINDRNASTGSFS